MRSKGVVDKTNNRRIFKYNIEAAIQQVKLNIRFPCKLSISWNYGEGSVTTVKPVTLDKGVAKFQEMLSYSVNVNFDDEKQTYIQQKTTLEVFIITENGNSLAGFVTIDLATLVGNQERKDVFPIQRCPDRLATVRMKLLYRFVNQKTSKVSEGYNNYQRQNSIIVPSQGLTRTEQYGRKNDLAATRNKQLVERQLTLLKSRVTQYQGKYKNQKAQRDKLNDLLKGKQEVYFTLKTEIKRRQIQMQGMLRSLDEYKSEYERLKMDNDMLSKQRDRLQTSLQIIERSSYDKISKLQSQNISSLKKIQKLGIELERYKKQKDSMALSFKQRSEGAYKQKQILNQSIRQLRKEKDDVLKVNRVEKQNHQKSTRELNRRISEYEQELNEIKQKFTTVSKKLNKLQESRMEQITRMNLKTVQIQKVKQTLAIQLGTIKKDTQKKEHNLTDIVKNLEKQLNEQRINSSRLTKSISEFQSQKAILNKQVQKVKQNNKFLEEEKIKLQKQIDHLKYQINGLNEIMLSKSGQLKSLLVKGKQVEEQYRKKQAELQQKYTQTQQQFQRQIKQLRKSEQTKYLTLTTNFVRKQRDLQDAIIRQQKLSMHIQTLKDEYKKNQTLWKQKVQGFRKSQHQFKQQQFEYSKNKEQQIHQLVQKLRQMQLQIYSLNETLSQAKENQFRLLQREQRMKVEQEQLHALYSELNLNSMRLREELQECRDNLQDNQRKESELNIEIESSEARYSKLVRELKDRIIQLETEKVKLQNMLREKQKLADQLNKSSREEVELNKKQVYRKQLEIKKLQDQNRDISLRDKLRLDQIEMELEKVQNQLIRSNGAFERSKNLADQLDSQLKNYKQNLKFITREKEDLIRAKQEAQADKRDLEEGKDTYQLSLNNKQKQIRVLKARSDQIQLQLKQLQLIRSKSLPIIQELCQVTWRLTGSQSTYELTNEYDNMMQIRKGLLILQTKLIKQQQLSTDHNNSFRKQSENYQAQLQRLNNDILKLKTHVSSLKKVEEDQLTEINILKIQNQDLCYQINNLQTQLVGTRSTNSVLDTKLKDEYEHVQHYQLEMKRLLEKYEGLLNETRIQLTQKNQKQKKQFIGTIRTLESKIESLEQKNFSLELEGQKISEYIRREEQAKKVLARMYELERQNLQLLQIQKDIDEKAITEQGKLQWQKSSLQQSMKGTITRLQKNSNNLQIQVDKLNTKNRQLSNLIKEKETLLQKAQRSVLNLQQQFSQQKNQLQQQRDRIIDSQSKLKNEIIKLKSQLTLIKKSYEQDKDKLFSLQSVSLIKNELDMQLQSKNAYIVDLEDKEQKLNQDIFKLTQQIQQLKWEYNQNLSTKQTEIMNIQQQLYTLNSKQNIRMLKQAELIEKHKLSEQEKKSLTRELQQYKDKFKVLTESQRSGDIIMSRDIQRQRILIVQNQKKHEQIIKILEEEINNLKLQSSLKKRETV